MGKQIIRLMIIVFILLLIKPLTADAAKKRTRNTGLTGVVSSGIRYNSVKISRNTNSINVTFLNLNKVKSVSYELLYMADGRSQGVAGSLTPADNSDFRSLYLGTCSHGVCTLHRNITQASLTIKTKLKTGIYVAKRYRLKI